MYMYHAAREYQRDRVAIAQEAYALCDYAINTEHVLFAFAARIHVATGI